MRFRLVVFGLASATVAIGILAAIAISLVRDPNGRFVALPRDRGYGYPLILDTRTGDLIRPPNGNGSFTITHITGEVETRNAWRTDHRAPAAPGSFVQDTADAPAAPPK